MDGFVILDIIISLAFIYLTYSLLTSIIVEIYTSFTNLRGRNLRRSIKRMLQDRPERKRDDLKKNEKSFVKAFFDQPTIKYLGKNRYIKSPSSIEPDVFSNTIVDLLLKENGDSENEKIENAIGYNLVFDSKTIISISDWKSFESDFETAENKKTYLDNWLGKYSKPQDEEVLKFSDLSMFELLKKLESLSNDDDRFKEILNWKARLEPVVEIDPETRYHLSLMYRNADEKIPAFKLELEKWFKETMKLSSGWYRQWTAKIAFVAGLLLAMAFNVDTLYIGNQLVVNEGIRTEMAAMIDSKKLKGQELTQVSDSLGKANQAIMSSFSLREWPNLYCSDTIWKKDPITKKSVVYKVIRKEPWSLKFKSFFGWIITALAISFGAPFWFDILNKFMQFKGAIGEKKDPKKPKSGTA